LRSVRVIDVAEDEVLAEGLSIVEFENAVLEVFAARELPRRRPDVLNDDPTRLLADSFVLPDESLAEVAAPFRRRPLQQLLQGTRVERPRKSDQNVPRS
jgi:hypothetical protein